MHRLQVYALGWAVVCLALADTIEQLKAVGKLVVMQEKHGDLFFLGERQLEAVTHSNKLCKSDKFRALLL